MKRVIFISREGEAPKWTRHDEVAILDAAFTIYEQLLADAGLDDDSDAHRNTRDRLWRTAQRTARARA